MLTIVRADELATMVFEPLTFVVEDLLPQGLVLLIGKPKAGKSLFATQLSLAIATGGDFLGKPTERGQVLYIGLEDNHRRLQNRLITQAGAAALPSNLHLATKASIIGSGLIEELEEWRASVADPRVVIIDTLGHVMSDRPSGQSEYQHGVATLAPVRDWALEHNLAVVLVHHERKSGGGMGEHDDPFDGALGSQSIFGTADTAMILSRKRFSAAGRIRVTGRDIPEAEESMCFDAQRLLWLPSTGDAGLILGVTDREEQIVALLRSGLTELKDIAAGLGTSSSNASNLLKKLEARNIVNKPSRGLYELTPPALTAIESIDGLPILEAAGDEVNEGAEELEEALEDFGIQW